MNSSALFKFGALALAAWATLANAQLDTRSFGILAVLILLTALLDAGNGLQTSESVPANSQQFTVRLFALSGAPFYVGVIAFVFAVTQMGGTSMERLPKVSATMCGAEGGCGSKGGCGSGGCGSSSGGACGCSSSKAKAAKPQTAKAPPRQLTTEELRQRTEEVQKRAMANGSSAGGLPGLGVNPRPLPPGLVPKAGVAVPPGVVLPASPPERAALPATGPKTASATSSTPAVSTLPAGGPPVAAGVSAPSGSGGTPTPDGTPP